MNPIQKLKWFILLTAAELQGKPLEQVTAENVDELYDLLVEAGDHWDAKSEIRGGEVETNLPCPSSRNYESTAVASKMPDGSWVGWTYWYGGGKYGEPEAIDWMEDAYFVDCKEEEKLVVVQTFSIPEPVAG